MVDSTVHSSAHPPLVHRRIEHIFFGLLAACVAIAVFIGFAHTYFLAGMMVAKLPNPLVHVHGAIFSTWIALLVVQVALAATGRIKLHMRLGLYGVWLAPLMVLIGFTTLVDAVKRNFLPPVEMRVVVLVNTETVLIFAGFVLWAYLARSDAASHKRLILLATFSILGPAIDRWPFQFMRSTAAFLIVFDSFFVLLAVYDLLTRRSLHRATTWGLLLTAAWQLTYRPLAASSMMERVVVWLQHG